MPACPKCRVSRRRERTSCLGRLASHGLPDFTTGVGSVRELQHFYFTRTRAAGHRPRRAMLATIVLVATVTGGRDLVERAQSSSQWNVLESAPPPDTEHLLTIAVKQRNRDRLEEVLNEVSTPGHPRHGKHLSYHEAHELTSNSPGTSAVVR